MIDRLFRILGPGHHGESHGCVDRVVDLGAPQVIAGDVEHHQIVAKRAQPGVAEPAAGRKIGQEYAPVLAIGGDQAGGQFRALGARQIDGDGPFALVQSGPV